MKIASYVVNGTSSFGVVKDDGVVTMGQRLQGRYASLRDVLAADALDEIRRAARDAAPDHNLSELRFLPVSPKPDKVLCVGLNYRSHAAEIGREPGEKPGVFVRLANTLVGHEGHLVRPSVSENLDFEGELAVIIGRGGRHIPPERASDHVAGYSCFVDGSVRDFSKHSLAIAKNFIATAPIGPWLVTTDEIPDPTNLTLTTRLNGKVMQSSTTKNLVHNIPAILAWVTKFLTLQPGDCVMTGTPAGVGVFRKPPVFMKPGDVIEMFIESVGTIRNPVVVSD